MDLLVAAQNMALWQICLTGRMQVLFILNCSLMDIMEIFFTLLVSM